jgi:hypothetical protein
MSYINQKIKKILELSEEKFSISDLQKFSKEYDAFFQLTFMNESNNSYHDSYNYYETLASNLENNKISLSKLSKFTKKQFEGKTNLDETIFHDYIVKGSNAFNQYNSGDAEDNFEINIANAKISGTLEIKSENLKKITQD